MRRMGHVEETRSECLRRAREYDWLSENSVSREGAAYFFDRARLWRSRALVAQNDSVETASEATRNRGPDTA
jgi:hypothetical protein